MKTSGIFLVLFFPACLPGVALAASLGGAASGGEHGHFGSPDSKLDVPNTAGFQSWKDWLPKRGFGDFPFKNENLQAWREFMQKRGLLPPVNGPNFGGNYVLSPGYQQWKDWMEKRGFTNSAHDAFGGPVPGSPAQFQSWSDWISKRGLGGFGNGANTFGQANSGKFQSWADFSKKADFGSDPDFLGMGDMQPWQMYKRGFGMGGPSRPFSIPFDSHPNLMKWDGMTKRNGDKRQLGNGPAAFGHYRQYFTKGLQDWRNMFQSTKRTPSNATPSKLKNNN